MAAPLYSSMTVISDFMIPLTEHQLGYILQASVQHHNQGRPHMSWRPGIPQPPPHLPARLQAHCTAFQHICVSEAVPSLGACLMHTALKSGQRDNILAEHRPDGDGERGVGVPALQCAQMSVYWWGRSRVRSAGSAVQSQNTDVGRTCASSLCTARVQS